MWFERETHSNIKYMHVCCTLCVVNFQTECLISLSIRLLTFCKTFNLKKKPLQFTALCHYFAVVVAAAAARFTKHPHWIFNTLNAYAILFCLLPHTHSEHSHFIPLLMLLAFICLQASQTESERAKCAKGVSGKLKKQRVLFAGISFWYAFTLSIEQWIL